VPPGLGGALPVPKTDPGLPLRRARRDGFVQPNFWGAIFGQDALLLLFLHYLRVSLSRFKVG